MGPVEALIHCKVSCLVAPYRLKVYFVPTQPELKLHILRRIQVIVLNSNQQCMRDHKRDYIVWEDTI